MYAHGAVFAEVKVDPDLGMVRVSRLVGAFAAGRIVNPKLARSQYLGGMIWGLSFALHEGAFVDRRTGRIVNADLGEYLIPTHADVPAVEALLIDEHDPFVNPLGARGWRNWRDGHGGRHRERRLACDRQARAPLPAAPGGADRLSRADQADGRGRAAAAPVSMPGSAAIQRSTKRMNDSTRPGSVS